jgi:hypothetical protein
MPDIFPDIVLESLEIKEVIPLGNVEIAPDMLLSP